MANLDDAIKLHNQGLFSQAEPIYKEVLNQNPDNSEVINMLGLCLYMQKKYSQAMPYFEKAIEKSPKDLQMIRDYAKLAKDSKQWNFAIKFYSKSLEIDKRDYVALNNIGLGLEELKDFDKAKNYYERSLKIKPNYHAFHNLGVWYRRARNFKQSTIYLKRALQLKPDNIETMTSLGMSYLSMKDFENGYKYYQHRCPALKSKFIHQWDGREHPDDDLVIYFDGGRGDQLMFCRYIPFIQEKFKNVIFIVYEELKNFLQKNFPDIKVCTIYEPYTYQFSVNLMELHYYLGMDFEHIPFSQGYLNADNKKIQEYKNKYFQTEKLKVGLFWQGNLKVFPYRSMKLEQLSPLFSLKNCQFFSCQKGEGIEQLEGWNNIIDLGKTFNDYSDTAAALKNLDILVTIDSSILHLAGALGIKTFLLLPQASEWRWFEDTQKTPWYESVEIFKQEKLYDWQPPIHKVFEKLKILSE